VRNERGEWQAATAGEKMFRFFEKWYQHFGGEKRLHV